MNAEARGGTYDASDFGGNGGCSRSAGTLQLSGRTVPGAVLPAENGREALLLFEQYRPQVAILEIEMPQMDGLETARRIRQSAGTCALLFLTARDDFHCAREALQLRAMNYLLKPWSEQELVRSVEEALRLVEAFGADPAACLLAGERCLEGEMLHASHRLGQVREDIEAFIREHYTTELSMQTVARAMNYSDAYFCKLFKQCFEVNFSVYLNEYRIARAKELLQSTRLNVREVSNACGYSDSNYFTRVFKRITGKTPSEYRGC